MATGNLRQVLDLVGVAEKARVNSNSNNNNSSAGAAAAGASAVGADQAATPTRASQQPR